MDLVCPPPDSLLTTIYSQCWPAPGAYGLDRHPDLFTRVRPAPGYNRTRPPGTSRPASRQDFRSNSAQGIHLANTHAQRPHSENGWTDDKILKNDRQGTISKEGEAELRRLETQVREVKENFHNRQNIKKYVRSSESQPALNGQRADMHYREGLSGSLQAFQRRRWRPITKLSDDPRCHHLVSETDLRMGYASSTASRPETPGGYVMSGSRPPTASRSAGQQDGNTAVRTATGFQPRGAYVYDALTPTIVYTLAEGRVDDTPIFGERSNSAMSRSTDTRTPDDMQRGTELGDGRIDVDELPDDDSSASGLSDDDDEGSDLSDGEKADEPEVGSQKLPEMPVLRPEVLDARYIDEWKPQRVRFDFDASTCVQPAYEFESPVVPPLQDVDFQEAALMWHNSAAAASALQDFGWVSASDQETRFVKRLLEMERLQDQTMEREKRDRSRGPRTVKRRQSFYDRVQSAQRRDRRCVSDCVQPACAGDCPSRRNASGSRPETPAVDPYCSHSRLVGVQEESPPKAIGRRPKSCVPCQKPNTARMINTAQTLQGRSRSSLSTYSKGQKCAKQKGAKQTASALDPDITKKLEALGLSDNLKSVRSRPGTAKSSGKYTRGRNGMIPGKTTFSQRKNSITDEDRRRLQRSRMKSIRLRRPKTSKS